MAKVSELKNIKDFGYKQLAIWGMIGALTLLVYGIIATIFWSIGSNTVNLIFSIIGLILGVLYMILGIFGIIKVVQKQEGSYWGLFLAAAIFAVLAPLSWFGWGGIAVAIIAGVLFLVYYLLEK